MAASLTEAERQRMLAAQRVLLHAVTVEDGAAGIIRAQQQDYDFLDIEPRDAQALSSADHRRVLIYRELVRANIAETLELELERTVARMSEATFARHLSDYLEQELPRSPILREVAFEFAAWAAPRWLQDDEVPDYLADLARYELFEFDVLIAPRSSDAPNAAAVAELTAEQTLIFDGSTRVGRFDHAVHQLDDDDGELLEPERKPTGLLGYRDGDNRYRQLELSPLATSIFAKLLEQGCSLAEAVAAGCDEHAEQLSQAVIDAAAAVVADLIERGAVVGVRAPGEPNSDEAPWRSWLIG